MHRQTPGKCRLAPHGNSACQLDVPTLEVICHGHLQPADHHSNEDCAASAEPWAHVHTLGHQCVLVSTTSIVDVLCRWACILCVSMGVHALEVRSVRPKGRKGSCRTWLWVEWCVQSHVFQRVGPMAYFMKFPKTLTATTSLFKSRIKLPGKLH